MRIPRIKHPLRALRALLSRPSLTRKRFCVNCGRSPGRFLPHLGGSRDSPPMMLALDVVGSDVDNFECPWCGCNDRERHLLLYWEALNIGERFRDATVLHFAPERSLSQYIRRCKPAAYLRTDLARRPAVDACMNMERIPLADNSVDVLIANHVLEHVYRLDQCLREIQRVIRPGGIAILQTPFSPILHKSFEDPGINEPLQRLHAYGQEDHVRLFGGDIEALVCAAGFESRMGRHEELLTHIDARRHGVNQQEPLFLFRKPPLSAG